MFAHYHTAHWHTLLVLLALPVLSYASAAAVSAEDTNVSSGPPTYRSTVSEVRVTFFSIDENNHPLGTLTKSDFVVVDNERVVRNFRSFTHSDETSLDVVVLVDLSESAIRQIVRERRKSTFPTQIARPTRTLNKKIGDCRYGETVMLKVSQRYSRSGGIRPCESFKLGQGRLGFSL